MPSLIASSTAGMPRSEEHTSELQSLTNLVCRLLLEKKNRSVSPRAWPAAPTRPPHEPAPEAPASAPQSPQLLPARAVCGRRSAGSLFQRRAVSRSPRLFLSLTTRPPPSSTLFPYTTLFRSCP